MTKKTLIMDLFGFDDNVGGLLGSHDNSTLITNENDGEVSVRPKRRKRLPKRFNDFVIGCNEILD